MASVRAQAASLAAEERAMEKLRAMASAHGLVLFPKEKLLAELGQAIARRMVKRRGDEVYQMVACTLPYFPKEILQDILPVGSIKEHSQKKTLWELTSAEEVSRTIGPLLEKSSYACAGSTKAFRTRSERVIRVVAKLMSPLEITHEVLSSGVERCYINGMYALATQDGEIHFPKDNERRELEFSSTELSSLRRGVLEDMEKLGKTGQHLSPNWWRQLGQEEKALLVEKQLADATSSRRSRDVALQLRRVCRETYEIEAIVSEKKGRGKAGTMYLVRWMGYDAAWEPWRISGEPGDPIETWEPAHRLRATEALSSWKETTRHS